MWATAVGRPVRPSLYLSRLLFGQKSRKTRGTPRLWLPLAALVAIALLHPVSAAPTKEVRRILILNEANPSYPAIPIINQGIQTALNDSPYHVEFYSEYFDTLLFPDPAVQKEFRDFYLRKYQNRTPDVIITVGPSPLRFMQEVHQRAFPGVPIVFCLPYGTAPGAPQPDSGFTGVENDMAPGKTIEIALRLLPATRSIVVVGGVSAFDRKGQATIKEELKPYEGRLDILYLTDLAVPDLLKRLEHLPDHTLVLLTSVGQDAAGQSFKSNEIGPLVAGAANAPVFSLFDVYLNHGEVGGYLSRFSEQAKVAGSMALRLLKGEKPQDIATVRSVETYMFDWRALKRWGLNESALPPDSIVLNRPLTIWESYKWYIISGISLILLQALLIGRLMWQRARLRKAETDLAVTCDRLRLAVEAGKSVGWDWDVQSGRSQWFGDLQTMLGIPGDSYSGNVEDFRRRTHPEDRELVQKAIAGARETRKSYIAEFRVIRADGTVRWITASGKFYYAPNGDPQRMLGMAVDITERKRAEGRLREYEQVVEVLGDRIMVVDREYRYLIANAAFLNYRGFEKEQVIGHTVAEIVGKEAFEANIKQHFDESFQGKVVRYEVKYSYPKLGERNISVAYFPIRGPLGIDRIGCILRDITERKLAEEALRESEERFRLVANSAPVMIWMAGLDGKPTYFNQSWLDFTGLSEADLLNGLAGIVHPEDYLQCHDVYCRGFDQQQPFRKECRLRRHDGQYRWMLDVGVPRFLKDGSFAGYIGTCIDVTDRKLAEDALTNMSRKLVQAQEQERARIARELHDDVSQRLALLGIALQQLREHYPELPIEIGARMKELQEQTMGISNDVQALSHELHSSKLEYLGAIGGMKSWCKEFGERQGIQIEFKGPETKISLPPEIGLSLFRVLQQALNNSAKHSGVRSTEVQLREDSGEIHLIVSDLGKGFDMETAMQGRGLGLASMQERVRLVNGTIEIQSKPMGGTTVHVRVPFSSEKVSERAVG